MSPTTSSSPGREQTGGERDRDSSEPQRAPVFRWAMSDSLSKPLFFMAAAFLALAFLIELGSPLLDRLSSHIGMAASQVDRTLEGARRLPLDEIGGLEEGKYLANRFTGGFELPGANRIIRFAVFPNEWISEVGTVGGV